MERSHKSLCCGGWIFYNLTGRFAIDEADAAAPFLDVQARTYSPELLDLYGMPWAERLLPDVLSDDERVEELTDEAAVALGLSRGLPVVLSLNDMASTAIGLGTVGAGQGCSVLGTAPSTEVGAKGAMIVGLVATGVEKGFATATRDHLAIRDTFEPDAGRHARYREWFEHFLSVRESSVPIWQRMAGGAC